MESSNVQIVLPAILAMIMFGMGLSLTRADFVRLLNYPGTVALGLLGQIFLMPISAYCIALLCHLPAELAVGLMILAACPGGTMSNVISQLAKANLALSVSLTTVSTLICVFTTPFVIQWSIYRFLGDDAETFSLMSTAIGLMFVTLMPVILGVAIREFFPKFSIKIEPMFRKLSLGFLIAMVGVILYSERETLEASFSQVFIAAISLNIIAILIGVLLGKLGRCPMPDTLTLGIEVGIQNASLAMLSD